MLNFNPKNIVFVFEESLYNAIIDAFTNSIITAVISILHNHYGKKIKARF